MPTQASCVQSKENVTGQANLPYWAINSIIPLSLCATQGEKGVRLLQAGAKYELTLVVHPEEEGSGLEELLGRVKQLVADSGGQVESVNAWGRRRLAYPVKKCTEGHYVVMKLEQTPQGLGELERNLKLEERLLRYLVMRSA